MAMGWLNAHGLVDGVIPVGTACPVEDDCGMGDERCPTREQPRDVAFSCGACRWLVMLRVDRERGRNTGTEGAGR